MTVALSSENSSFPGGPDSARTSSDIDCGKLEGFAEVFWAGDGDTRPERLVMRFEAGPAIAMVVRVRLCFGGIENRYLLEFI